MSVKIDHKSHKIFLTVVSLVSIALTLMISLGVPIAFYYDDPDYMDVMVPTFAYVQHYLTLFILQFVFVCLAVRERFKILNGSLR